MTRDPEPARPLHSGGVHIRPHRTAPSVDPLIARKNGKLLRTRDDGEPWETVEKLVLGWGTWIRTRTSGVRVRGSTVKLSPSGETPSDSAVGVVSQPPSGRAVAGGNGRGRIAEQRSGPGDKLKHIHRIGTVSKCEGPCVRQMLAPLARHIRIIEFVFRSVYR